VVRLTSIAQSLTKRKGQKIIRHIAEFDTLSENFLDHPKPLPIPHLLYAIPLFLYAPVYFH